MPWTVCIKDKKRVAGGFVEVRGQNRPSKKGRDIIHRVCCNQSIADSNPLKITYEKPPKRGYACRHANA